MKRVLLIDDDEISNFLHEKIIMNCGVVEHVYVCLSAKRALELLNGLIETGSEKYPDLIFLDIRMPVMNGFGFLDEFNKLPGLFIQNIKIAMLTSSLEENEKRQAFEYKNVVAFISKPLTEDKV